MRFQTVCFFASIAPAICGGFMQIFNRQIVLKDEVPVLIVVSTGTYVHKYVYFRP